MSADPTAQVSSSRFSSFSTRPQRPPLLAPSLRSPSGIACDVLAYELGRSAGMPTVTITGGLDPNAVLVTHATPSS